MDAVELKLDRALFAVEVLARTAHRYTADYFVDLRSDGDVVCVHLAPKRVGLDSSDLAQRFHNDALDDRLRAVVAQETNELQAALIRAALTEAQPREPGEA